MAALFSNQLFVTQSCPILRFTAASVASVGVNCVAYPAAHFTSKGRAPRFGLLFTLTGQATVLVNDEAVSALRGANIVRTQGFFDMALAGLAAILILFVDVTIVVTHGRYAGRRWCCPFFALADGASVAVEHIALRAN